MKQKPAVVLGVAIALASLAFITERLWTLRGQLLSWEPDQTAISVLIGVALLYAGANFLLSSAWRRLLLWFGEKKARSGVCRSIYARSQIAKYIPGNVFHIAGRHLLACNAGLNHGPLVVAALYEILLLLGAAGGMTLFAWSVFGFNQKQLSSLSLLSVAVGVPTFALFVAKYLPKIQFFRKYELQDRPLAEILSGLAVPFLQYLLFLLAAGVALLGTSYAVRGPIDFASIGAITTFFAIAYIAGLITPGSPSGIGIREGILVITLSGSAGEANALLIALLFRIATVSGDLIFFLIGFVQAPLPSQERN